MMQQDKNKSSKNKVIKASIGYTIGNYLIKGLSFFTLPIFTRLLSTYDYGIYNTFIAYEGILFVFISLAIHSSYKNARYKYKTVEEGANKGKDYQTYISDTIVLLIINLVLWILGVNFLSKQFGNILDLDRIEQNLLILYSFSTAIITCFNSYVGIDYKYKSFLIVAAINAISNVVISIILIITFYQSKRYLGRIVGTAIPSFVISLFLVCWFIYKAKPDNLKPMLRWGIRYSLPIVPHGISQIILSSFDRIMIARMVSAETSGIYSFGYTIFSIIAVTTTSLDNVWSPWFYEKMNNGQKDSIRKYGSLYIIFMFLYSAVLMLISPEIVKILGAKEYWDSIYCVIPLVAGGFFSFLYNLPASIEYYYEKTKYIMLGTMAAAILNIALNYIFILKFGYIAAAYTTLVTYLLYFLFHYFLARKIEGTYLYDNKVTALSCLGIAVMSLCTLLLVDFIIVRWIIALAIGITMIITEEKKYGYIKKRFQN